MIKEYLLCFKGGYKNPSKVIAGLLEDGVWKVTTFSLDVNKVDYKKSYSQEDFNNLYEILTEV